MDAEDTVTVIIATYNAERVLENCLLSVLCQTHNAVEIVVRDGGSTDGTLSILEKYGDKVRFVSEPDFGIGDAHQKGVEAARGTWLYFLGADDLIASPMALEHMFAIFQDLGGKADIITAHALYDDGRIYRSNKPHWLLMKNTIHHQGALYRRSLFNEKKYDTSLKVYYDYDFNIWARLNKKKFIHTEILLGLLGAGGLSDRPRFGNYLEDMRVRARYLSGFELILFNAGSVLRFFYKKLRHSIGSSGSN